MPENTIYVGRPTTYGNPFPFGPNCYYQTREQSIAAYRQSIMTALRCIPIWKDLIAELRGKNLACWCALDRACHADVLLEVANA